MLAGIKKRIGYSYHKRGIFLTNKIPIENGYEEKHVVDYHLGLLSLVDIAPVDNPKYKVHIPPIFEKKADEILVKYNMLESQFVCLMPGAGASWGKSSFRRRWSKDKFTELTQFISNNLGLKVVLLGSPDEKEISDYISLKVPSCINLCGKTDLLLSIALMKKARLLVTNDGGPLHMAAAVGIQTVSIHGPVDSKVYGAYPPSNRHIIIENRSIACRPCYKSFKLPPCDHMNCIQEINVETVQNAVKKALL